MRLTIPQASAAARADEMGPAQAGRAACIHGLMLLDAVVCRKLFLFMADSSIQQYRIVNTCLHAVIPANGARSRRTEIQIIFYVQQKQQKKS